jgi:hypothetical protein
MRSWSTSEDKPWAAERREGVGGGAALHRYLADKHILYMLGNVC